MNKTSFRWMNVVFLFQGLQFIVAKYLWTKLEGCVIAQATKVVRSQPKDITEEKREEIAKFITEYVTKSIVVPQYFTRFVISTFVIYLLMGLNVIMMASAMGMNFSTSNFYDPIYVFKTLSTPNEIRTDPLIDLFPHTVRCLYSQYGPSGTIMNQNYLCSCPLNSRAEICFLVLFYMTTIMFALSILDMLLIAIALASFKKMKIEGMGYKSLSSLSLDERLVFMLVRKNVEEDIFHEIIFCLQSSYQGGNV